jgi:hypothetical protein
MKDRRIAKWVQVDINSVSGEVIVDFVFRVGRSEGTG